LKLLLARIDSTRLYCGKLTKRPKTKKKAISLYFCKKEEKLLAVYRGPSAIRTTKIRKMLEAHVEVKSNTGVLTELMGLFDECQGMKGETANKRIKRHPPQARFYNSDSFIFVRVIVSVRVGLT